MKEPVCILTSRENEILAYTAYGYSAKEIAYRICRSEYTVQTTICNIKKKIGLQKASELVAYFYCRHFKQEYLNSQLIII